MIAYVPGRRRTARSTIRKWSLIFFALTASCAAIATAGVIAYDARPDSRPITVVLPPLTVTPEPYRPVGPDPSLPAMYSAPLRITLGPRTASAVTLHLGPSEDYVVLGTLQAGSPLQVVGRDETGDWLAIVFPPNSTFRAWLPVSETLEVDHIGNLPVEPVHFLP